MTHRHHVPECVCLFLSVLHLSLVEGGVPESEAPDQHAWEVLIYEQSARSTTTEHFEYAAGTIHNSFGSNNLPYDWTRCRFEGSLTARVHKMLAVSKLVSDFHQNPMRHAWKWASTPFRH